MFNYYFKMRLDVKDYYLFLNNDFICVHFSSRSFERKCHLTLQSTTHLFVISEKSYPMKYRCHFLIGWKTLTLP